MASTLSQATAAVCQGGELILLGLFVRDPPPTLPAEELLLKEASLLPSKVFSTGPCCGAGTQAVDLEEALSILASRPWLKEHLVSHTFPLHEAAKAFEAAMNKATSLALKIMVKC